MPTKPVPGNVGTTTNKSTDVSGGQPKLPSLTPISKPLPYSKKELEILKVKAMFSRKGRQNYQAALKANFDFYNVIPTALPSVPLIFNTIPLLLDLDEDGIETVPSSIDYTLDANVENLTLTEATNLTVIGNACMKAA